MRDWLSDIFADIREVTREMDRAFGESGRRNWMSTWHVPCDVKETEKEIICACDLPGSKKEDLRVELKNGTLTISGERKMEKGSEGDSFHRVERSYGSFMRSFSVPADIKETDVKARFEDGILEVVMPKPKESSVKRITIN